jgi:hypothetical protein
MNRRGFLGVLSGALAAVGVGVKLAEAKPKTTKNRCSVCGRDAVVSIAEPIRVTHLRKPDGTKPSWQEYVPGWAIHYCGEHSPPYATWETAASASVPKVSCRSKISVDNN